VALADAFMKQRPEMRVTFHRMDSGSVVEAVRAGVAELGVAEFVPPAVASGVDLTVSELARVGIAIIVNPANTVSNLTLQQVRSVFGGGIRNWKDLGGADRAISLVLREEGSGTRRRVEERLKVKASAGGVVIQDTSGAVVDTVANDANAVGYVLQSVRETRVRPLDLDGVPCTDATLRGGSYPLVTSAFLLAREQPGGLAAAFLAFVESPAGKEIMRSHGLTPAP
jgi:phosphate transport system substrate-binding protein